MTPGVFRGVPNDVYHGGPGISKSGLDLVRKSPAHYRAVVNAANDNEPRKPTAAQFIGTAFHALLLEPASFVRDYCLGLQREDVPDAIDDRERLVAMVAELNAGRKAKLPTGGAKADLVERIVGFQRERLEASPKSAGVLHDPVDLEAMKGTELKAIIEAENANRTGLLPTSGSRHDLAEILRANGVDVTLWSDVQAEWLRNNGHRTVLTREQWDQLHNMRDAVMAHPAASRLLSAPGESELSCYWEQDVVDPTTQEVIGCELCRVRPDFWRHDGIVVDLKTTEDASEEAFARSIATYGYHVQDAFYRHGIAEAMRQGGVRVGEWNPLDGTITYREDVTRWQAPRAFVFVAVEKTACVVDGEAKGVAVYSLDDESRALGAMQWQADLRTFARCKAAGQWPGYSPKIRNIKLPAWQAKRTAETLAAE